MKHVALLGIALALVPATALAANDGSEDRPSEGSSSVSRSVPLHASVAARTDVPLFVGGAASLEHVPTRLRLTGAVGVLPSSYARMVNGALSASAYDARLGRALDETMTSGLSWNVHLGWRPLPAHGLLLELGYASATLKADGDARSLAGDALGNVRGLDTSFRFASRLDIVDARVGWEWVLADHLLVQVSGGLSRVVAASTSIEQSAVAQNTVATSAGDIDSAFRRYGYIPTASAAVGYEF
ncbi:MAG: hypothetical protein JWP97_6435 [Labilithrix sp.]|nr:hypothetical protein [Labilithrix sp.]